MLHVKRLIKTEPHTDKIDTELLICKAYGHIVSWFYCGWTQRESDK